MDGITALPLLLAEKRDLIVIMASTLTLRNAEISLKALSLGAADYVPKPESNSALFDIHRLPPRADREGFGPWGSCQTGVAVFVLTGHLAAPLRASRSQPLRPSLRPAAPLANTAQFKLRPYHQSMPKALVIGSSTGGPQALDVMLRGLSSLLPRIPVLITQHMPGTFTTILAAHIAKNTSRPCYEAEHGMIVQSGSIYVARGGKHMVVRRDGTNTVLMLEDTPPVNFCKPAVDPMFTSAAAIWGASLLGVVLTGMGSDGARGAGDIVRGGGNIFAQDEATSVVWGMPGATAMAGSLCRRAAADRSGSANFACIFRRQVVTPADYEFLQRFLKEKSGLVLTSEKQYLIESRLQPVAKQNAIASLTDLVARLKAQPSGELAVRVTEAMTTNESFFFRDKVPFDHFKDVMLPYLIKERAAKKQIRIWCAAASTGQEPYSLAMILKEAASQLAGWRIEIIGTDLSQEVLGTGQVWAIFAV